MTERHVEQLHEPWGANPARRFCTECSKPYPCATIIALKQDDPLATPLRLPQNPDGSWPGDPRMGVRVRSIYGYGHEQIIEATSLRDALEQALEIPFAVWMKDLDEQHAEGDR